MPVEHQPVPVKRRASQREPGRTAGTLPAAAHVPNKSAAVLPLYELNGPLIIECSADIVDA
jgi:hypothetical protein